MWSTNGIGSARGGNADISGPMSLREVWKNMGLLFHDQNDEQLEWLAATSMFSLLLTSHLSRSSLLQQSGWHEECEDTTRIECQDYGKIYSRCDTSMAGVRLKRAQ